MLDSNKFKKMVLPVVLLTATISSSNVLASTLSNFVSIRRIPLVSMSDEKVGLDVNVSFPEITLYDGFASINKEYVEESKKLYDDFLNEIGAVDSGDIINRSLTVDYEVIVNNGDLLVIRTNLVDTAASSKQKVSHKNIDVKNKQIITLNSLFKDKSYIEVITGEIQTQMAASDIPFYLEDFNNIEEHQDFYINSEGELVICFDKYEIAPGYVGPVSFVIPTEIISDILLVSL